MHPSDHVPYERLLAEFEQSEHLADAKKRVEELKAEVVKKAEAGRG